jgi:hypothetical protein
VIAAEGQPARERHLAAAGSSAGSGGFPRGAEPNGSDPAAEPRAGRCFRAEDLAAWPLRDATKLAAVARSVPHARRHARHVLREWQQARFSDAVELVAAELVTNAVAAAQLLSWPSPLWMWLLSDRADAVVAVWDASSSPPRRIDPEDDAENGRGLLLVEAICARWGWQPIPETGGKVTWAVVTD